MLQTWRNAEDYVTYISWLDGSKAYLPWLSLRLNHAKLFAYKHRTGHIE